MPQQHECCPFSIRSAVVMSLLAFMLPACATRPVASTVSYAVGDTLPWDCGPNGGFFTVLSSNGQLIDSVDVAFGIHELPNGLLFAPVATVEEPPDLSFTCPQDPVLLRGAIRRPLQAVLPLFNPSFPAIAVTDSALLYWGFRDRLIYAGRLSLLDAEVDTVFLSSDPDLVATDNRFQFFPPEVYEHELGYTTASGIRFRLNYAMRLVAVDTIGQPSNR